jgi:hypothetical protein
VNNHLALDCPVNYQASFGRCKLRLKVWSCFGEAYAPLYSHGKARNGKWNETEQEKRVKLAKENEKDPGVYTYA